jgi:serine/threonine protein kinase
LTAIPPGILNECKGDVAPIEKGLPVVLNFTTLVKKMGEADKPAKNTSAEAGFSPSASDPDPTIDSFGAAAIADAQRGNLEVIGPYRRVRKLGQGGMGQVWVAERSDGRFERKAAVKFLNVALMGQVGEDRFKREGAILGRFSHRNIAELLDAGVSSSGQPYIVLEYVEGEAIDRSCDQGTLDVKARISLSLCRSMNWSNDSARFLRLNAIACF